MRSQCTCNEELNGIERKRKKYNSHRDCPTTIEDKTPIKLLTFCLFFSQLIIFDQFTRPSSFFLFRNLDKSHSKEKHMKKNMMKHNVSRKPFVLVSEISFCSFVCVIGVIFNCSMRINFLESRIKQIRKSSGLFQLLCRHQSNSTNIRILFLDFQSIRLITAFHIGCTEHCSSPERNESTNLGYHRDFDKFKIISLRIQQTQYFYVTFPICLKFYPKP